MVETLTKKQEAQIYCVKHGHAKYIWNFFGYVHCGRCSSQIGDRLMGSFSTSDRICLNKECKDKDCMAGKEKLNEIDKEILKRLFDAGDKMYDYDEILKGIDFGPN